MKPMHPTKFLGCNSWTLPFRILMQSAYEMTVQEYESFDDTNNVHMAETYLVKFAENGNTSDGKKADIAVANGLALLENFRAASDYFYYGDEMRNAYLSAYEGAYRADDEKLYQKAAALAVLYILYGGKEEYLEEAAACLREACIKCRDISGIEFIFENAKDSLRKAYAFEVLRQVSDKAKAVFTEDSVKESLSAAKEKYAEDNISAEIPVQQPPKPVAADTEGRIVSLNGLEKKGKITGKSGSVYEFEFKETDEKISKMIDNIIKRSKSMKAEKLAIDVSFVPVYSSSKLKAEQIRSRYRPPVKVTPQPEPVKTEDISNDANKLFTAQRYEEANS